MKFSCKNTHMLNIVIEIKFINQATEMRVAQKAPEDSVLVFLAFILHKTNILGTQLDSF